LLVERVGDQVASENHSHSKECNIAYQVDLREAVHRALGEYRLMFWTGIIRGSFIAPPTAPIGTRIAPDRGAPCPRTAHHRRGRALT